MDQIKEFLRIILPNNWTNIALENVSQMFLSSTGYMTKPPAGLKGGNSGKLD